MRADEGVEFRGCGYEFALAAKLRWRVVELAKIAVPRDGRAGVEVQKITDAGAFDDERTNADPKHRKNDGGDQCPYGNGPLQDWHRGWKALTGGACGLLIGPAGTERMIRLVNMVAGIGMNVDINVNNERQDKRQHKRRHECRRGKPGGSRHIADSPRLWLPRGSQVCLYFWGRGFCVETTASFAQESVYRSAT